MVFAAVPDDVTIEKLTNPEKAALDEYLGRERRSGYFENLFRNPTTPPLLAGTALLASAPTLLKLIFNALEKNGNGNGNGFKAPTKIEYAVFVKDFAEGFFELTGPTGGIFFKGEAQDFWEKYVTK